MATGTLLTVDNQIDPNTVNRATQSRLSERGRRAISQPVRQCAPAVDVKRGTTLVPSAAVQRGPQGTFVFVVKGDHTVGVRAITVGVTHGEESSVESGVVPDDLVVVDGAEKLRDGTKVEIRAPRDASARYRAAADRRGRAA